MALIDIRCGLSGFSTRWLNTTLKSERPTELMSMALLVQRDDQLVPLTPPVTGTYSGYGSLDGLGVEAPSAELQSHPAWLGKKLRAAWDDETLVSSDPEFFEADHKRLGRKKWAKELDAEVMDALSFLHLASETAYNKTLKLKLTWDGAPVYAWIYLEPVADVIVEAEGLPANLDEARTILGGGELFNDLDAYSEPVVLRYASVVRHAVNNGGLIQVGKRKTDPCQRTNAVVRRLVKEGWAGTDAIVTDLVKTVHPDWVRKWRRADMEARLDKRRAESLMPDALEGDGEPKKYSPRETFAVGDTLEHPKFGQGKVIRSEPMRIQVKFTDQERALVHGR